MGPIATSILAMVMATSPESLKVDLNDYACMAEALYFEARGESAQGQIAVANVILNRVESSRYPDTICGVVEQNKQFSYLNYGDVDVRITDKIEKKAFQQIAAIAFDAVQGELSDNTGGADHYYAHHLVQPFWVASAKRSKVIGNHTFAKL